MRNIIAKALYKLCVFMEQLMIKEDCNEVAEDFKALQKRINEGIDSNWNKD